MERGYGRNIGANCPGTGQLWEPDRVDDSGRETAAIVRTWPSARNGLAAASSNRAGRDVNALLALGWGSLGALAWGLSALSWTFAIRRGIGIWPMLNWVFVWSLLTATAAAILVEGSPNVSSTALLGAVAAGILYAVGDAFFFRAVDSWLVALVAPIVACSGAVGAVLAVLAGEPLAAATALGLAIMVLGLIAVATRGVGAVSSAGQASQPWRPIGLAAAAAGAFGAVLFVSGRTAGEAADPLWLVGIARAGAIPLVAALCLTTRQGFSVPRGARRWVISAGIFDALGYAAFIEGSGHDLPVASIALSQYAAITAIGGVVFLRERFTVHQGIGVVLMLVGAGVVAAYVGI